MRSIPMVPAILFKAVTTAVDNLGISSERFVEKAGVPLWQYSDSHTLLPGSHFYRLVGQAAVALGTDKFGYLIARHTPIAALDEFGQRMGQSLTVYDAIKTFNRLYAQMSTIDRFWSVECGQWVLGDDFSLVDITLAPLIDRADNLGLQFLWSDLPSVTEWLSRIHSRPSFIKTMYKGSRISERLEFKLAVRSARKRNAKMTLNKLQ